MSLLDFDTPEGTVKEIVRARDGFKCIDCGMTQGEHISAEGRVLDVHRLSPGSPYYSDGCVTVCRECHGKRHRGKRLGTNTPCNDLSARVDAEVAYMAKVIAAVENTTIAELLTDICRPVLLRRYEKLGFDPAEIKSRIAKPKS